jgi:hypothetical protein
MVEKEVTKKGSATSSVAEKKESTTKPAAKSEAAKIDEGKAAAAKTAVIKTPKAATAATAKAGALKDSDMKAAAKKINAVDKTSAENASKSNKSVEDLKLRAHEAKQRAQKKILEKGYVSDKPTDPLERLANTFDTSARRWEMVVYPSIFAFVILAGYGFFLIYRLTHDMHTLSESVTHMAIIVSDEMPNMTKDLNIMTGSMNNMTDNIQSMTYNIGSMNRSVYGMQRDMHGMNRTVSSGPFGMMNDMMPFSSNTNVPPPLTPQPVWPAYRNPVPYYQAYPQPRIQPVKPVKPLKPLKPLKPVKPALSQKNLKTEVTMPGASSVTVKEPSTTAR